MGATHPQNDERTKTKQSYRVENCEECNAKNRHKGRHEQRVRHRAKPIFAGNRKKIISSVREPIAGPIAQPFAEVAIGFILTNFRGDIHFPRN